MALFTVHVPTDARSAVERADRTVFVRDGFNGWAFLFGWLYLLRHRLWLACLIWLGFGVGLALIWWRLELAPGSLAVLALLAHLFLGVEGNDIRRWGLARRRFSLIDVVSASRRSDAEYAFFLRQPDAAPVKAAPPTRRTLRQDMTPSVIGMFPDEGTA